MNVVIIEDEPLAAEALAAIINRLRPQTQIAATLGSVEEAVDWLELNPAPDLIFCDIHLSDGNSFEIFRQVAVTCPVIFTTAYNQYAVEAFSVHSIDYLLKPIKPQDVAQALKKYEERQKHHLAQSVENLQQLVGAAGTTKTTNRSRFMVRQGQVIKAVSVEEVAYFLAEEGVVFLVTAEGKRFIINNTLDQLEEQLDKSQFFRVNRQFIVHIDAIKEVRPYFKGRLLLIVSPPVAEEPVVSSGRAAAFKDWLDS